MIMGKNETDEKERKWIIIILFITSFFLWILAWFVPYFVQFDNHKRDEYCMLFTALSALFTGIAFGVAYYSIFKQQKKLQKQIEIQTTQLRLNVFTDSMKLVMDNPRFIACKNYILSNGGYSNDMSALMHATHETSISLVMIENILEDQYKGNVDFKIMNKKSIRKLYNNVTFFCARMNILGNVYENDNIGSLIIDYYGRTITLSYNKVRSFVESTNKDLNFEPYSGYTKLFEEAQKRNMTTEKD